MARARRRGVFVRPPGRTKMWIGAGVGSTSLSGNAKTFVSSLSGGALLLRPFTILRTRMEVFIHSDQSAASETLVAAYGKIVVTDTAAAIGVTAIPDPSGISGAPEAAWFVWQAMANRFLFGSSIGFDGSVGHHYEIDSKSMRKVGPDDDVVGIAAMETVAGATMITHGRMLIQLH